MYDFANKTVLITGAAGNLGRAVAECFRSAGASLVLVARKREKLERVFGQWASEKDVWLAEADLTDEAAIAMMVDAVAGTAGPIDVLVNTAGAFTMGPPLQDTELSAWEFMLDVNAKSVFLTMRAFLPQMLAQESGHIINVAARAGLEATAHMGPYAASKSAVIRMTEAVAAEVKGQGLNVNCVLPGTIDTPQNRAAMPKAKHNRWVTPGQIANVILFLAAPASAAVHGAAIPVYGAK